MASEDQRRKVVVHVGKFSGHGTHFHVTMREEADSGRERMMKFRSREKAMRWIEYTFRREFNPATHELVFAEDRPRWFYPEGE
ncbi:MAG: hypothetical protein EA404_05990 [Spirochaetaceae bacterium]|nr:MAG: hypothetical protein EA404_05990 [Spirochaetaceae bacterium]